MVPGGSVHHDQIPTHFIDLRRKPFESQSALGFSRIGNSLAVFVSDSGLHKSAGLVDLGVVADVVGLEGRDIPEDLLDPSLVLFEEDGAAAVIEGGPHEAVVAQAEDEEITGGFLLEDAEGDGDFFEGLLRGDVCCGVVDQSVGEGRRGFGARLGLGIRITSCGGGGGTVRLGLIVLGLGMLGGHMGGGIGGGEG